MRPGIYLGFSSRMRLGGGLSHLVDVNLGIVFGGATTLGRLSIECRYRRGIVRYGYFSLPGLDKESGTVSYLLGIRL